MSFFDVKHRSKKSKARVGEIRTAHGTVQTPSFVPCATKGTLKGIMPDLIPQMNVQLEFVNTYHLVTHPGSDTIEQAGGIHKYSRLPTALMSDSGGFQVFSLGKSARRDENPGRRAKAPSRRAKLRETDEEPLLVTISEDGVTFRSTYDGTMVKFTPETSIHYQRQIGADIMMAFDECTYYPATLEYATKSMQRTHDWLLRCIVEMKKVKNHQFLYGIIQGGQFQDLRKASAEFVTEQDTDGVAIGGVSVGETKEEMRKQVLWCRDFLPDDKPVHLLGIGQFDDFADLVTAGIDTFDCVEPSRLARIGIVYQWREPLPTQLDINKTVFKADFSPLDDQCDCYVCQHFTKSYMSHLFKQRELLAYTLATFHNIYTVERFMMVLRDRIGNDEI